MVAARDPEAPLPLSPAMLHVLLALADQDLHGYAILKDVASRTNDKVRLGPGTLYGLIGRLLSDGLIEESRRRPPAAQDDERRRYYRLTPYGRRVLVAEVERLEATVAIARSKALLKRIQPA